MSVHSTKNLYVGHHDFSPFQEEQMTIQEATAKGFLNLTEDEAAEVLDTLFDNDDAEERLSGSQELFGTFLQEEKIGRVLDLSSIFLDAYDELGGDDEDDHDHDHDHDHNGHDHHH